MKDDNIQGFKYDAIAKKYNDALHPPIEKMITITNEQLIAVLDYGTLIPKLKEAFTQEIMVPLRHHHEYKNPKTGIDSTLLMMPAWIAGEFLGIKIVTVSPKNSQFNIPTIQGQYMLYNAQNGSPIAMMDAKTLTNLRTAAASALASSFLSKKDSTTLLMVGTGALAPELIKAHATVRPIKKVLVWGRDFEKAQKVVDQLKDENYKVSAIKNLEDGIQKVDIISTATLSKEPLIKGEWLKDGQHIDLVGSFQKDSREADDEVILRSEIYADTIEGASQESGDLVLPLKDKIITKKDIVGDLFSLCKREIPGRTKAESITCFKSVGHGLEDLATAILAYSLITKK